MAKNDVAKLTGFAAVRARMTSPRKSGGGGGARQPRGVLNAAHRLLTVAGGSHDAQWLAYHLLGGGLWVSNSVLAENTLVNPLNSDYRKGGGLEGAHKVYDPTVGSIITKTGAGQFALREGSPPPLKVPDADIPLPEYVADVKAETCPDYWGYVKKGK